MLKSISSTATSKHYQVNLPSKLFGNGSSTGQSSPHRTHQHTRTHLTVLSARRSLASARSLRGSGADTKMKMAETEGSRAARGRYRKIMRIWVQNYHVKGILNPCHKITPSSSKHTLPRMHIYTMMRVELSADKSACKFMLSDGYSYPT